jgi:hypothetical protein
MDYCIYFNGGFFSCNRFPGIRFYIESQMGQSDLFRTMERLYKIIPSDQYGFIPKVNSEHEKTLFKVLQQELNSSFYGINNIQLLKKEFYIEFDDLFSITCHKLESNQYDIYYEYKTNEKLNITFEIVNDDLTIAQKTGIINLCNIQIQYSFCMNNDNLEIEKVLGIIDEKEFLINTTLDVEIN